MRPDAVRREIGADILTRASTDPGLALRRAASEGFHRIIEQLAHRFEDRLDVEGRSTNGNTALMWAAQRGHAASVVALLNLPNVSARQRQEAAKLARTPSMKGLIEGGWQAVATFRDSATAAFPLRFPQLYLDLAERAGRGEWGPRPAVLVIGPGRNDMGSPQLAELLAVLPQAHFTVVEQDAQTCTLLRAGRWTSPDLAQEVDTIFAQTKFTRPDAAEQLHAMLSRGLRMPAPDAAVEVIESNVLDWVPAQHAFDIAIATYSLTHAESEASANQENGFLMSMPLYDGVLRSLRPRGALYVDCMSAESLDLVVKRGENAQSVPCNLVHRSELAPPLSPERMRGHLHREQAYLLNGTKTLMSDVIVRYVVDTYVSHFALDGVTQNARDAGNFIAQLGASMGLKLF